MAPECGYFGVDPGLQPGEPVHIRAPGGFVAPAALDPGWRYFAVSTDDDGMSVWSLAWGTEVHRIRGVRPQHWAWVGPGRMVYRKVDGEQVAVDFDRGVRSTFDDLQLPASATMRPDAGLVAWLTPERCDASRCDFELVWAQLGQPPQHTAFGSEPWRTARVEWIGHGGEVVVALQAVDQRDRDRRYLVVDGKQIRLSDDQNVVHERWRSGHLSHGFRLSTIGPGGQSVHKYELDGQTGGPNRPRGYFRLQKKSETDEVTLDPPIAIEPRSLAVDRNGTKLAWSDVQWDGSYLIVTDLSDGMPIGVWPGGREIVAAGFADQDCGLVAALGDGRLRYFSTRPNSASQLPRGLAGTRASLLAGSLDGALELIVEDAHVRWSTDGLTSLEPVERPWYDGRWLVDRHDDAVELRAPDGAREQLAWPEIDHERHVRRGADVSPDGRLVALSSTLNLERGVMPGESPTSGRVDLRSLADGSLRWSLEVDPLVTALALTDDALWTVVHEDERARFTAHDVETGEVVRRWSSDPLPAAVVALAVHPDTDAVYGLLPGQRRVWQWSQDGRFARHVAVPGAPFPASELGNCPCDLSDRWLRVSDAGDLLIVEAATEQVLIRLADAVAVTAAEQIVFAREPGFAFTRERERIHAWASDADEPYWSVQLFAEGEWVWWDAAGLIDLSAKAAEMVAPRLELVE